MKGGGERRLAVSAGRAQKNPAAVDLDGGAVKWDIAPGQKGEQGGKPPEALFGAHRFGAGDDTYRSGDGIDVESIFSVDLEIEHTRIGLSIELRPHGVARSWFELDDELLPGRDGLSIHAKHRERISSAFAEEAQVEFTADAESVAGGVHEKRSTKAWVLARSCAQIKSFTVSDPDSSRAPRRS